MQSSLSSSCGAPRDGNASLAQARGSHVSSCLGSHVSFCSGSCRRGGFGVGCRKLLSSAREEDVRALRTMALFAPGVHAVSAACEGGDKEEAMWADVARVYAANRQLPDGSERVLEAAYATGLRSRLAPDGGSHDYNTHEHNEGNGVR